MRKFILIGMAFAFLTVGAHPVEAEEESAWITKIEGECSLKTGELTQAASPGLPSRPGDLFMTHETGKMDFSMRKLIGCRLLPSSSVSLLEISEEKTKVLVHRGNVILNLAKLPQGSRFELETPTAVATVRGTQFWGRVMPMENPASQSTTFAVQEGSIEVHVKTTGQSFTLHAGQAIDIPKEIPAGAPAVRPALEEELAAMAQASEITTSI